MASASNAPCTASRARAWASWNSSSTFVGSESPLRPRPMRAGVAARKAA
jgi:hypothetical protein